jgi:hypothetical protein
MDKFYSVDYRKLSLLLLPTMLRKSRIVAFIYSVTSAVSLLHSQFTTFGDQCFKRLSYNSQTCRLQACVNDYFDSVDRRIVIENLDSTNDDFILYNRSENRGKRGYNRTEGKERILYNRGFSGSGAYDFIVKVPTVLSLSNQDIIRLTALVNTYKLASKRFSIIYV